MSGTAVGPGSRLGSYEILAPLGAGGMGEVYRARDARLAREVAIKVLPQDVAADASRLKRFEKEARSASALNHPNIVTIYEIGSADAVWFIAMERVEGRTLRDLLLAGPLPNKKLLSIAAQIADGLARAHEAGIVHRDLKPENLMVTKDGLVKILDFGLAKQTRVDPGSDGGSHLPTETGTSPGVVLGTVGYMSPEQAAGQPVDFRSDQFAFGSILYEMATGKRAFQKGTAVDTLSAILHEEPRSIGEVRPQAPPPLRWIVGRCLAKEPDERYAATRDLARDLAAVRDHVSEVFAGAQAPLAAPARRRQILLALVSTAGALALGAAGWGLARGLLSREPPPTTLRRLTFRSGGIHNARFAPDGQTVVYGATWQGETPRLYQMRLGAPESRPFDFEGDILAISPSGEMAVLQNSVRGSGILARVPMAGGTPRQVLEGVFYASADWDPGGKELVVAHEAENALRLEYPIGHVIHKGDGWSPRFSPNGDAIAFFEHLEGADAPRGGSSNMHGVSIIDPSGKNHRVLSSGWVPFVNHPVWRPDGKEVWFTASKGVGQPEAVWGVTRAGKLRFLLQLPGRLELFDVSRDGRVLLGRHTFIQIVRGRTSANEKERELSWLDGSEPADLSDDGKTLVLTEMGEGTGGTPMVYLRPTDGSPATKLGEGEAIALSPDGRWVLASSGKERSRTASLLPTRAGQVKSLPGTFNGYGGAAWFPDGKRFVFSAEDAEGRRRIYLQSVEEGAPRPISPEGFWMRTGMHVLSPDGKWVVGMKGVPGPGGSGRSWWLVPTAGGEPRPVPGLESGDNPLRWSEDGRSLFLRPSKVDTLLPIWLLDTVSGQRRQSAEIRSSEPIERVMLSSDPGSFIYSSQRTYAELLLIEGLR